ncbi:MAG: T9SS type A sorting domain-containing protein, partial [Chryseobacterium sp.]|nr:T9SS type A sorting domain-containing protein [Chryseobacterium sp.]
KADFPRQIPLRPYVITYEIFSMDGKLIVPKKTKYIFDQDLQQINLKHLPTESYMIHVTVDGEKIVKKLMMIPK